MSTGQVLLALLGGIVGAGILRLFDIWRENQREKSRMLAALIVLRDEIRRNLDALDMMSSNLYHPDDIRDLTESAAQRVELEVARGLPSSIRSELARIYAFFPGLAWWMTVISRVDRNSAGYKGMRGGLAMVAEKIRHDLRVVDGQIAAFIMKSGRRA